jgi:hypothetical protein
MSNTADSIRDLKRRRRFVRTIVVVGIATSVAANVLGAEDSIAAAIAGWPPIALLLSLEVLTRVPASKRLGAFGRVTATIGVAFAAGWLSYWHMAATVSHHGEAGGSQYIWPLSVDGLMTVGAIALVELGARIRQLEASRVVADTPVPVVPVPVAPPAVASAFEQAQQAVRAEWARTAAPVSPAPASSDRRISGTGPVARRIAKSPLTGKVLMEAPRV